MASEPKALITSLEQAMRMKGWGPTETAAEARIGESHLYKILAGKIARPQLQTLTKLARALDAPGLLEFSSRSTPAELETRLAELEHEYEALDDRLTQLERLAPRQLDGDHPTLP